MVSRNKRGISIGKLMLGGMASIGLVLCLCYLGSLFLISQLFQGLREEVPLSKRPQVSDESRISFFEVNESAFENINKMYVKEAPSIQHDFSERDLADSSNFIQALAAVGLTEGRYEQASQRLILAVPAEHDTFDGSIHGYAYCTNSVKEKETSERGDEFFVPIKAHWYVYHCWPSKAD